MLPEAFEEFEVAYIFLATFCFLLSLSIGKRLTLGKIWRGGGGAPAGAAPSGFYEPAQVCIPLIQLASMNVFYSM